MVDAIMYFGEFLQEAYLMKEKSSQHKEAEEGVKEDVSELEDQSDIDSTLPGKGSQILVEDLESGAKLDLRRRRAR
jgi:hypothetical protein